MKRGAVMIAVDDASPLAEEPWLLLFVGRDAHVLPERESMRHELDRGCSCAPVLEVRDPFTLTPHAGVLVLHHSAAQRAHRGT